MGRKILLFITSFFAATSVSTGYRPADHMKGNFDATAFLDWFSAMQKYAENWAFVLFDVIPGIFLFLQAIVFFRDGKKAKGALTVIALLLIGAGCYVGEYIVNVEAAEIATWSIYSLPGDWIAKKDAWMGSIGKQGILGLAGWFFFLMTYFVPPADGLTATRKLNAVVNIAKNVLLFLLAFICGLAASAVYERLFPVLLHVSGNTFIAIHRPLDLMIREVGKTIFPIFSGLHLLLALLFFLQNDRLKSYLILLSLVLLLIDTYIALQLNRPLNDLFLTWTPETVPANWNPLVAEWLDYHMYRNILGFLRFMAVLMVFFVPVAAMQPKKLVLK